MHGAGAWCACLHVQESRMLVCMHVHGVLQGLGAHGVCLSGAMCCCAGWQFFWAAIC